MSEHWLVQHIWLIPLLPLAATLLTAVLGPRVLRGQSHWPCIVGAGGAALLAIILLAALAGLQTSSHGTAAHAASPTMRLMRDLIAALSFAIAIPGAAGPSPRPASLRRSVR